MTDLIDDMGATTSTEVPDGPPRRRGWWIGAASAVVAVVAVAGGVGAAGWDANQNSAHAEALTEWRDARNQLAQDLNRAEVILTDSQHAGLADDPLTELQSAITAATDLDLDIDPALPRSGDITRAREVVAAVEQVRVPLASATAGLRDAAAVHRAALGLQALDQATEVIGTALAELDAATAEITDPLAGAREYLASSEGRTGSNHDVRVALTNTIDAAVAELGEADALRVQVTDTTARLDQLRAALEEIRASPSTHTDPESVGPVHVADAGDELAAAQDLATALAARATSLREHHLGSLAAATKAVGEAEVAAKNASTGSAPSSKATAPSTGKSTLKSGSTSSGSTGGGSTSGSTKGSTPGSTGGGSTSGSGGGSHWVEDSTDFCGGGVLGQDPSWWGDC